MLLWSKINSIPCICIFKSLMKHEEFKGTENIGAESISLSSKGSVLWEMKSFRFKGFHISNFYETLNSFQMYISERKKKYIYGTNCSEILLNISKDGLHRNAKEMVRGFKCCWNLYWVDTSN